MNIRAWWSSVSFWRCLKEWYAACTGVMVSLLGMKGKGATAIVRAGSHPGNKRTTLEPVCLAAEAFYTRNCK